VSSGIATTAAGGAPPPAPDPARRGASESSSSWSLLDRLGLAFAWGLGILFCAIIVAIIAYVAVQGIRYLHPDLLWTNPKTADTEAKSGGFLDPIIGTFLTSGLALAIATPVGIGVAVWLSEYNRPKALARLVEMTVEMLAGAPSVVLALFGIVIFDSSFLGFLSQTNGGIVFGKSCFAAGLMLSFVALPLIVSTVREGLQAIPNHVREASYAVGKSKITTIRRILLPAARPSVITGSMLGLGHSLGDTAIIVLLAGDTQVIQPAGSIPIISDFRGTASTLTSFVFDNAPTGDLNHTQLAWAAAFVLMLIVLTLNLIVDVFSRRSRELKWS
jgi:phosphate transport system permease protein